MSNNAEPLAKVAEYYTKKLADFGTVPQGVDWNGEESQHIRFEQLCKLIDPRKQFTINDIGCGYGALFDFLLNQFPDFTYIGIDVASCMVDAAINRLGQTDKIQLYTSAEPKEIADYSVASGIFNVFLNVEKETWRAHFEQTLFGMDRFSRHGFSFNCLTTYSDAAKMKDYLYYFNPCEVFDFCKLNFSRNVALVHDYDLYEFTVIVRKLPWIDHL